MVPRPILITAPKDGGKSTYLQKMLQSPPWESLRLCGVLSLANPEKTEYTLKSLTDGQERLALTERQVAGWVRAGRFCLDEAAFDWANEQIIGALEEAELAVFDEIGRLELGAKGLARAFRAALGHMGVQCVALVRTEFVQAVDEAFCDRRAEIRSIGFE